MQKLAEKYYNLQFFDPAGQIHRFELHTEKFYIKTLTLYLTS